ncbi:hypothetical protein ABKV19_010423 [Rosa sericea]
MAHPSSVIVVEVCRVAPVTGSPDFPTLDQSLPLFDLRWLRFKPVERLYFYETSSPDSILPKLKTSLSLTLQHFLPLAGKLTWPLHSLKPILSYVQGDTVSLTIAESDAENFNHLSNNVFVEPKGYHPLVPKLDVSYERAAAMALQITLFPNRGFSIGTTMHHGTMPSLMEKLQPRLSNLGLTYAKMNHLQLLCSRSSSNRSMKELSSRTGRDSENSTQANT